MMGRKIYVVLVALGLLVGCGKTPEAPIAIKKANLRSDFKDSFKSAFENMAKETQSASGQKLSGLFSKVMGLVGHDMGSGSMDPNFMKDVIEKIFESDIAKSIFSDENITSQSDTQIVYGVKNTVCDKVAAIAASESELIIKACKLFLADHEMEFRVGQFADKTLSLELWHANAGSGSSEKKFVIGLNTSPNSFGTRFDLSGAKGLIEGFISLAPQDPISPTPLIAFNKAKGAVSLQVRFKSAGSESGCKDNDALCFVANVDDDIDLETTGEMKFALSFGKSSSDNPSATLSTKEDGSFKGSFNLGALDFKMNMGAPLSFFLEKSEFVVSVPTLSDSNALEVLVENFKAGKNPSFFEGMGKKVMLDLANEARMIERIRFFMDAGKALVDLSPLALVVSIGDSNDEQCTTHESVKVTTHKSDLTKLSFSGMPGLPANERGYRGGCSESNLMVFPFWGLFHVSSSNCDRPMSLAVKQGSLEMSYDYQLNGSPGQPSTLLAEKDQCLQL